MKKNYGGNAMSNKVYFSDPHKDKIVYIQTYKLLVTLHKLGLEFNAPIREIMAPTSEDGNMMDEFIRTFVRLDDE